MQSEPDRKLFKEVLSTAVLGSIANGNTGDVWLSSSSAVSMG